MATTESARRRRQPAPRPPPRCSSSPTERGVRDGRPEVRRPAGDVAAHDAAARRARRRTTSSPASGFDGSSIRGFQEIHESDMLLMPDPATAFIDPYYTRHHAVADLLDRRPGAGRAVRARPAVRRPEGRAPPDRDRDRRRRLLRPRGRVLRVRPHRLRAASSTARSTRSTPARASGTPGSPAGTSAEPGLQAAPEGGLLPGAAGRLAREPARRDGRDDGVARDPLRVPPPRGVLGRPGRDRHALPAAAADGRPDDDLQVRGQEHRGAPPARPRRSCPSRSSRRTAPACTCTSRCGRTASR